MLDYIRNMTIPEFSRIFQRINGYRAENNAYWAGKQREMVLFLEEVERSQKQS